MSLISGLAIYFIIWWLVLFIVLPFGIRNAHEAGADVGQGHAPGAPVNPRIKQKFIITTIAASAVFALVYALIVYGGLSLDDLPFVPDFKLE